MKRPRWPMPDVIRRYSPLLLNGVWLVIAVTLAKLLVPEARFPAAGFGLALMAVVATRAQALEHTAGFWRHAFLLLPAQLGAGMLCLLVGRFVWDWPWAMFSFLPIWMGLSLLSVLRFLPAPVISFFAKVWTGMTRWLWAKARDRVARGDDLALTGAGIAGCTVFLVGKLSPSLGMGWGTTLAAAGLWLLIDLLPFARWQQPPDSSARLLRFFFRIALWFLAALGGALLLGDGPARDWTGALLPAVIALIVFGLSHRRRLMGGSENLARILLGLLVLAIVQPFATHQLRGSGDAVWYLNTLIDFLAQARAGVFPVFVGQSEHLFNGGVMPVRFAPLFQHYGLAIDLLTLQSLSPAAVQNAVVISSFVGAAATVTAMLSRLLPGRPWHATGLCVLFLTCPGVLAIVYHEDLFMTWSTLPWLALAFGGCALSLRTEAPGYLFLTGFALGLVWWGHAPVALWSTLAIAAVQLARLAGPAPRHLPWRSLLAGAAGFLPIALYPFISVLAVPVQTAAESLNYTATAPDALLHFIHESFPGILIPLFFKSRDLADFQPGWALLVLLGLGGGLMIYRRVKSPGAWILLAVPLGLQLLLLPVPWLNHSLWHHLPGFLVNPTGAWPMQRLYVIIAISGVCTLAVLLDNLSARKIPLGLSFVLVAGVLWSATGIIPLLRYKEAQGSVTARSGDPSRPENLVLTRYAYLVFGHQPGYYSHGHLNPFYEQRFLDKKSWQWTAGNPNAILTGASARTLQQGSMQAAIVHPGDPWQVKPRFRLEPHKQYALELHFTHPAVAGVLLLNGPGFSRLYALPSYGEKYSFGSTPESSPLLSLFTSGEKPIEVTLQFAAQAGESPVNLSNFGTYRWLEVDPHALPVRLTSWIPYQAEVDAPADVWLETPRMFQTGYHATVNGQAVSPVRTPEGLVALPVPAGRSTVALSYQAPPLLLYSYWISATAIIICCGILSFGRRAPISPLLEQ